MPKKLQTRWAQRCAALIVWLLVAVSAAYWAWRLTSVAPKTKTAATATPPPLQTDPLALARLLGASKPEAKIAPVINVSSRFLLLGVLADAAGAGAALIAIDGKPAKPFRVGSDVSEGYQLQSVKSRVATLVSSSNNATTMTLEMPPLKK